MAEMPRERRVWLDVDQIPGGVTMTFSYRPTPGMGPIYLQSRGMLPSSDPVSLTIKSGDDGQPGTNGREVQLQASTTAIQWRYAGETGWSDLVSFSTIRGQAKREDIIPFTTNAQGVIDIVFKTAGGAAAPFPVKPVITSLYIDQGSNTPVTASVAVSNLSAAGVRLTTTRTLAVLGVLNVQAFPSASGVLVVREA